ncbi:MAG TPA: hypothetical protein V6C97_29065 [Oculatellaceae cyanobacterium]
MNTEMFCAPDCTVINRLKLYMAVASSLLLTGFACGVSSADTEASYQSSSESQVQSSSMNQRVGESEGSHQSETQAGTGSVSSAQHDSSSESTHVPNPMMAQPSLKPIQTPTAAAPIDKKDAVKSVSSNAPVGEETSNKKSNVVTASAPHARVVNYHWGTKHKPSRVSRSYMVQTIHQAAR